MITYDGIQILQVNAKMEMLVMKYKFYMAVQRSKCWCREYYMLKNILTHMSNKLIDCQRLGHDPLPQLGMEKWPRRHMGMENGQPP